MKIRNRVRLTVAFALVVSLAGVTAASAGERKDAVASKPAVKVMVQAAWNTPIFQLEDLYYIVKNGAAYLNKHGGINGAKVDVIPCNDQDNPNDAIACARTAVSDGVVALMGFTAVGTGEFKLLQQHHIPFIGGIGLPDYFSDQSPVSFPLAGYTFQTFALDSLAAQSCKSVVVLDGSQGPEPAQLSNFLEAPFVKANNTAAFKGVVYFQNTVTDMTPYVVQAEQSNPDCIVTSMTTNLLAEMLQAMQSNGVLGKWKIYGQNGSGIESSFVSQYPTQTSGWIADTFYQPLNSTAQWRFYNKMNLAAGDLTGSYASDLNGGTEQWTWVAWQAFIKLASTLTGKVTAPKVLHAASTACSLTLVGLSPTIDFCNTLGVSAIKREFDTNFTYVESENGKLVALPGHSGFTNIYNVWVADGSPAIPGI